ncbi:carbohydrate sulfotransferase 10-like [Palaemon carinicauda]|uniref:carbohydrate sulfotransferase 10-like n=1 Tax=Palaemon carinicauda TaxID=392227 RepID=UPI0035B5FDE0
MKKRLKKPLIVLLVISVIGSVSYSLTYKGKQYVTENDLNHPEKLRVLRHYDSQPENHVENDKVNDIENVKDLALYDSPTNSGTAREEGFQIRDKTEETERTLDYVYGIKTIPAFGSEGSRLRENTINKIKKDKPFKSDEDIKQEQNRRRKVIEKVCKEFSVEKDIPEMNLPASHSIRLASKDRYIDRIKMNNFYLARSASSMTCLLNKVASTSVAVALLKSDGRAIPEWTENVSPHNAVTVLNPKTEAEFKFAKKHFFKFLLVRHPFERLLSAYRDKVERANHWSLKLFREHIIETLKNNSNSGNHPELISEHKHKHKGNDTHDASIHLNNNRERSNKQKIREEKFSTISRSIKNSTTTTETSHQKVILAGNYQGAISSEAVKLHMPRREIPSVKIPTDMSSFRYKRISPLAAVTFRDFLEYILLSKRTEDRFSSHWSPFWETCSPCSVTYDVIAKLESAEEDLQLVHERMGLTKNAILEGKLNKSPDSINSKQTTLASYYVQLDPTLIGRVYRRFVLDFHLFEYDILDVFRLAGHCRTSACNEMRDYL